MSIETGKTVDAPDIVAIQTLATNAGAVATTAKAAADALTQAITTANTAATGAATAAAQALGVANSANTAVAAVPTFTRNGTTVTITFPNNGGTVTLGSVSALTASILLSNQTGVAQSAINAVIGTVTINTANGTPTNPVLTMTSNAGGAFKLTGNQVQFATGSVAAGSYSVTLQYAADNLAAPVVATFPLTITAVSNPTANLASSSGAQLPGLLMSWDAAMTTTTASLTNGVAGIQLYTDPDGGANSVAALIEPVGAVKSDAAASNAYGRMRYVANGGPNNYPYFRSHPSLSYHSGWDGLIIPPTAVNDLYSQPDSPLCFGFVLRHTGAPAQGQLVKCEFGTNVNIYSSPTSTTSGAMYQEHPGNIIHQTETEGDAPLNTWMILTILCDGHRYHWYRNGKWTGQTDAGDNGGFLRAPNVFCLLNNSSTDVAVAQIAKGAPSIAQHNAWLQNLGARFGISVQTVTVGSASYIAPVPPDLTTAGILTTPNYAIDDVGLTRPGYLPTDHGITMKAGATNHFFYAIGSDHPNANITTDQQFYNRFHLHFLIGNPDNQFELQTCTGHGTDDQVFWGRGRHTAPGDPYALHVVKPNGVHVRAIASKNRTLVAPGAIWSGIARPPHVILPGSLVKWTYKIGKGPHGWCSLWRFSGEFRTPRQFGSTNAYMTDPNGKGLFSFNQTGGSFEIDDNDNYSLVDYGVPHGKQLATQVIGKPSGQPPYYVVWTGHAPTRPFDSTANGFSRDPSGNFYNVSPLDATEQFVTIYTNWRDDGSNLIDFLQYIPGVGAKVFQTAYMEYDQAPNITDAVTNVVRKQGMHLLLSNQPVFTQQTDIKNGFVPVDQDGFYGTGNEPDGWSIVLKELTGWKGEIQNPDSYR